MHILEQILWVQTLSSQGEVLIVGLLGYRVGICSVLGRDFNTCRQEAVWELGAGGCPVCLLWFLGVLV